MKTILVRILFVLALFLPTFVSAADDLGTIRARMSQRLPSIDEMKAKGAIGENNRGFLEVRGDGADNSIVTAENQDREVVYAALAKQTNTSTEQVARARARQIAQQSRVGVWLQDPSGDWRQK